MQAALSGDFPLDKAFFEAKPLIETESLEAKTFVSKALERNLGK
jgi:hypothetical protein